MPLHVASFRLRRLVTNVLLLSSLAAAASGVALFLRPEGSLARWLGWSLLGLDKKRWENLHLLFVALFVIASLAHLAYNWRPALASLREKTAAVASPGWRALVPSRELLVAIALVASVLSGTLVEWRPFASLVALRTAMKDGAFTPMVAPPTGDADRMTVAELCSRAGLSEAQALSNARARGLVIRDASVTLGAAARACGRPPEAVYRALLDGGAARAVTP